MSTPQTFKKISNIFASLFIVWGTLGFIGWLADITFLRSISEGWVSLKINTSIWLILLGIALFLWNQVRSSILEKRIISIFSSIVFLMSCLTILEYAFGFTSGIDELFFKGMPNEIGNYSPGRPIPVTAFCFLLFSSTLLPGIRNSGKYFLIQSLYLFIGVISFLAGTGYVLGTPNESFSPGIAYLSIYSGISFFIMMLAGLFSRPDKGLMKQISSNTIGGSIFRKTFFFFIPGLIILGWLRLLGIQAGWYNAELSIVFLIAIAVISFALILYLSSSSLTKSEQQLNINEEQLLQINTRLEKAEELAGLGSWEIDISDGTRKRKWSSHMFRLFGLQPADHPPTFEEFLKLLHPDDREKAKTIFIQLTKGEKLENIVFRTNPKMQRVKYLLPVLLVEKNSNNEPLRYFGTIQDITERVTAENKIKEREELFSRAFHSKVFGLAIVNKERRIVDINNTLTDLIGFTREDFIGKTTAEMGLTDPAYIKKRDELLQIILLKGRLENYELDIIAKHGKSLSLLLSVEPLQLDNEQHWLIYLKNITERRIAEKKLKESENRLRTILDTEPECVKIIDKNGELTYINPAGLAMMEADNFEMVKGRKGYSNIHESYLKEFYKLVTSVFAGTPAKMEYEITGFKGTHRWMETHMVPLRDAGNNIDSLLTVTRDISERKKSDAVVNKAIERYELIGRATNDAIWEWDLKENKKWGNDSFYNLYRLNKKKDSLESIEPYLNKHPEDIPKLKTIIDNAFHQKASSVEMEFRFLKPDNSYGAFLERAFISYDKEGNPERMIGAIQDISQRRKAEDAIRQSEEMYRTLVEQASDAIFIINMMGGLVTTNDVGCQLSGYTREELMQMTVYDIVYKEDLIKNPFRFDQLVKGNTVRNERKIKTKDGIPVDVEVTAKLLTNGNVLIFGRDLSDRKKAEKKLVESEQRLSRAERMGNLGYGFYDIENKSMHLSAGLYKIFGVSPETFSHTIEGLKSVIHPDDFLIQNKAVDTLFVKGSVDIEFRILRPDGDVRNVLFKTVLTKSDSGTLINSFTTALDITENRKAEEQIKLSNVQLKQLAANLQNIREEERRRIGREIHDELGQWLTVLKMEIARVKKIKGDEEKLNEAIAEMLEQVDGCIKTSRRISTELRPSLIDDLGLIAALEWQADEFGKKSMIRSIFTTDVEELELLDDFTIGIFRIFQESLTNVARHAEATTVTSNLYIDEGNLILKIIDNGKGFDTSTIGSKRTLGLIGMKERTLLMNGDYNINSSPGDGTEITVIIPMPVG